MIKIKYTLSLVLIHLMLDQIVLAQEKVLYKQIDSTELFLEVLYPAQVEANKTYPAMVFFSVADG